MNEMNEIKSNINPVGIDEKLSIGKSLFYGFQSVLAMNLFLGAMIIAGGMQMDVENTALLLTASFFATGIATCIQAGFFLKYPVIQGASFVILGAIIAIGTKQGMATANGSLFLGAIIVIVMGYFNLFSKFVKRCVPPMVAGTVVCIIGISIIPLDWTGAISATSGTLGINIAEAGICFFLVVIFLVIGNSKLPGATIFSRGAILYAIIVATVIAGAFGSVDFSAVASAPWFALPSAFPFGAPKFELSSSLLMVFIYILVMVETLGCWFAISAVTGDELHEKRLNKGLIGEGIGCLIGAFLGGLPVTSYSTNAGVIQATKIFSRWAAVAAGVIVIVLALCPKLMYIIACVPAPVMWGASGAMVMLIFTAGLRVIQSVELNDRNMLVIGIPIFMTIGIAFVPSDVINGMPSLIGYVLSSPMAVGALTAIVFNLIIPAKKASAPQAKEVSVPQA